MKQAASLSNLLLASALSLGAVFAAPPENCCCELADGTCGGWQRRCDGTCTGGGGQCGSRNCGGPGCTCVEPTPSPVSTPATPSPVDGSGCDQGGGPGGPRIAMAWVSDQFANFDQEYDFSKGCTNKANPSDPDSNQFKCCHDWLVDSFAGINTVSLAFLKPTEIADPSTCTVTSDDGTVTNRCTSDGVRVGMPGAIEYFNATMDLVFVSIGGATYTDSWEEVLADDATAEAFADKVVAIARKYNVGVEIDYEESADPLLGPLEAFVRRYRDPVVGIPFESGADPSPSSFLTIDFGQGAQFMGKTADWVARNAFDPDPSKRLLNWANAMVGGTRQSSTKDLIDHWGQHINGYSTLQTVPIAPAYLVGSVWSSGQKVQKNCVSSSGITLTDPDLVNFINGVEPCIKSCGECKAALPDPSAFNGGDAYTRGMLGYAYWMVGNISPRRSDTCPTDVTIDVYGTWYDGDGDCANGFGAAQNAYATVGDTVNWAAREY